MVAGLILGSIRFGKKKKGGKKENGARPRHSPRKKSPPALERGRNDSGRCSPRCLGKGEKKRERKDETIMPSSLL